MKCGYCDGAVIDGENGGYVHADDGERVTVGGPGDMVSARHNRAGSQVLAVDVVEDDDEHDGHAPDCTACEHDCVRRFRTPGAYVALGAEMCGVCDDHAEAVHAGYGDTACDCPNHP